MDGGVRAPGAAAPGSPPRPTEPERTAARSFAWAALAFGGNRVVVFGLTLVLARLLAPEDFGVLAAGMTLVGFFEIALDLGVGSALIYEQEEGITARVQVAFTLNLLVATVCTAVGVAVAPAVAGFFQVPGEDAVFRVLCLYLLLRGAGQVHDAILKRNLDFRRRTLVDVGRAVIRAAVAIPLAWLGLGVWALVWGLLAAELAGTVANWLLVRFVPHLRLDRAAAIRLLRFGVVVVALKVFGAAMANVDYLAVGNRLGPEQLGFYSIGYRLPELLLEHVYWIFSSVAFPVYARARAEGLEAFRRTVLRALMLTTLFGFAVGTGLALVARDAVPLLFSPEWQPAALPMALIALALGLESVGYASGDVFFAIGKPGRLLKIVAPLTVVLTVGLFVAAGYGLVAVASVHLVFALVHSLVRLAMANRLVGTTMGENLTAMRPGLVVSAAIAVCALPVRLLTDGGPDALLAIVVVGAVGGLVGLGCAGRPVLRDLREIARNTSAR